MKLYSLGEHLYIKGRIGWKGLKKDEYLDQGNYRIINATALEEEGINWDDCGYISKERFEESPEIILKDKDILISKDGTIGKLGYVKNLEMDSTVASGIFVVRNQNEEYIDTDFLYYYFKSPFFKWFIKSVTEGSVIPHLYQRDFTDMEFNLFNLDTQKKCSSILNAIEEKINVNRKINKNLEELIKHIYINWFEDFEPFKGNTFHDTKLGKIPNGWNVKPLHKFIKFQEGPGIRNWQYVEEDGINFLNIRCIQNNDLILNTANMISKEEANGKYAHFMLNEWDLVISSSGTLGRYAIVRKEHLPLCLNTSIIRFKPLHSINHYAYIYSYLTSRGFYHYLLTMGSGSVQLNFGPTHLKQIDLIVPPEDVLKRYNETVFPIIEKIVKIKAEINKLTKLRDTLLPKLMSGEIDVSKINCDLELKYNYMKYLFNQIHTPMSKSVV